MVPVRLQGKKTSKITGNFWHVTHIDHPQYWGHSGARTFEPLLPSFSIFPQAYIWLDRTPLHINVYTDKYTDPMGNRIAALEVSCHSLNLPVSDFLQIHYHFGVKLIFTDSVTTFWLPEH
jgi:hypothetical protein